MTHVAMDVHKTRSTFAYRSPGMADAKTSRCYTTREDLASALGELDGPLSVVVESSRQSPAVCKWLRELAVEELRLADAGELHNYTKGKPKTDRRDALKLLKLFESGDLSECYLASEEVQDHRALSRGRETMRAMSTTLRNTVRSLLAQQGHQVGASDLMGESGQAQIEEVLADVPFLTAMMVRMFLVLLGHIEVELAQADAKIRAAVADDPIAQALMQHPGVGPLIAFGLVSEIGRIDRFPDPKRLISYAGLAPRARDSDGKQGQRHLPQRCSKRLRHWAVLAAQSACRSSAGSRARSTYDRISQRRHANVAKIAAARTLMQDIFWRWHQATVDLNAVA